MISVTISQIGSYRHARRRPVDDDTLSAGRRIGPQDEALFRAPADVHRPVRQRYTAEMVTSKGTMRFALDATARPGDGEQLRLPRPLPLLRRDRLPPHHPRVRRPRRRPDRDRDQEGPATSSPTSCPSPVATRSARWRWPTPGRTPTAASSSSSRGRSGVSLPPLYSLFGKAVSGLDVLASIEAVGSASGKPARVGRHRVGDDRGVS